MDTIRNHHLDRLQVYLLAICAVAIMDGWIAGRQQDAHLASTQQEVTMTGAAVYPFTIIK